MLVLVMLVLVIAHVVFLSPYVDGWSIVTFLGDFRIIQVNYVASCPSVRFRLPSRWGRGAVDPCPARRRAIRLNDTRLLLGAGF